MATTGAGLLARMGMRVPIIQAPMAGVSTPQLAAAVSNAGGLGSLGLGASSASAARQTILDTQKLLRPGRPLGVNLFVHPSPLSLSSTDQARRQEEEEKEKRWMERFAPVFKAYDVDGPTTLRTIYKSFLDDGEPPAGQEGGGGGGGGEMLAVLLETKPTVISFHFGLPSASVIRKLKASGAVLLATATNVREAEDIADAGLEGIVAQGWEAGGHRGMFDTTAEDERLDTIALVRLVRDSQRQRDTSLPIIAAGGIMDGRGVQEALSEGCIAAQLGTAFVGCPESAADKGYRQTLFDQDRASRTTMVDCISGRPARALANKFTQVQEEAARENAVPEYPRAYDLAKALHAAAKAKGEWGYGAYWAGQGATRARKMGAEELMDALVREWKEAQ